MSSGNLDSGTTAEELEAAFAPKKAAAPKSETKIADFNSDFVVE